MCKPWAAWMLCMDGIKRMDGGFGHQKVWFPLLDHWLNRIWTFVQNATNSQVGAGVEVLGNLETPRVNLVANEPMSEKDKLSWLILNRASSGTSTDEAALATAAGAFLAGSLNDKVGLVDDFWFVQPTNAQCDSRWNEPCTTGTDIW